MVICPGRPFICKEIIRPSQTNPSSLVLVYNKRELDTRSLCIAIPSSMISLEARRLAKGFCKFGFLLLSNTVRAFLSSLGQVLFERLFGCIKLQPGDGGCKSSNCGASPENGPRYSQNPCMPSQDDGSSHWYYTACRDNSPGRNSKRNPNGRDDKQSH